MNPEDDKPPKAGTSKSTPVSISKKQSKTTLDFLKDSISRITSKEKKASTQPPPESPIEQETPVSRSPGSDLSTGILEPLFRTETSSGESTGRTTPVSTPAEHELTSAPLTQAAMSESEQAPPPPPPARSGGGMSKEDVERLIASLEELDKKITKPGGNPSKWQANMDNDILNSWLVKGTRYKGFPIRYTTLFTTGWICDLASACFYDVMFTSYCGLHELDGNVYLIASGLAPGVEETKHARQEAADAFLLKHWAVPFAKDARSSYLKDLGELWKWVQAADVISLAQPSSIAEAVDKKYEVSREQAKKAFAIYRTYFNKKGHEIYVSNYTTRYIGLLTNTLACISKRGRMTNEWVRTFFTDINAQMEMSVEPMDSAELDVLWGIVEGGFANATIAEISGMFQRWKRTFDNDKIPLKVRHAVTRATYAGITSYRLIYDAIRLYPNVRWDKIGYVLQKDFKNYMKAFNEIKGGEYYGFMVSRMDCSYHRTKFIDLANVAATVMLRAEPVINKGLSKYKGVKIGAYKAKDVIDSLIDDAFNEEITKESLTDSLVQEYKAEVLKIQSNLE